jgi:hypothetical protein
MAGDVGALHTRGRGRACAVGESVLNTNPKPTDASDDETCSRPQYVARCDQPGPARPRANLIISCILQSRSCTSGKSLPHEPRWQSFVRPSATDGATLAVNNSYAPIRNMHAALAGITGTRARQATIRVLYLIKQRSPATVSPASQLGMWGSR